jgi:hypothetical protein
MRGSTHPGALESGADDGKRSVSVSVNRSRVRICIRLLTAPDFLGFANCHRDQNGRHPFSFQELPDSYVRIIPKVAKPKPIAIVQLNTAAESAPLLNRSAHPYLAHCRARYPGMAIKRSLLS